MNIENKKLLIYIGANKGYGLTDVLWKERFDRVIAFEPDPEMFQLLMENCKTGLLSNITYPIQYELINAACTLNDEIKNLYVFKNRVSTSLGDVFFEEDRDKIEKVIQVQTLNLKNFLIQKEITYIDYLITDCQGSDFNIIKTIKSFIEEKKIGKLFCETHKNNYTFYEGLHNDIDKFKEILSNNYEISYFSHDGIIKETLETPTETEWDTCWVVKPN